jgi:hypothetical protein
VQRKIYVYFAAWLAAVKETKLKDVRVQNHILPIFALKARAMCMCIYPGKPKVELVMIDKSMDFLQNKRRHELFTVRSTCTQGLSKDNVLSHLAN